MSTNLRKAQKHMQRAKELLNQSQLGFGVPSENITTIPDHSVSLALDKLDCDHIRNFCINSKSFYNRLPCQQKMRYCRVSKANCTNLNIPHPIFSLTKKEFEEFKINTPNFYEAVEEWGRRCARRLVGDHEMLFAELDTLKIEEKSKSKEQELINITTNPRRKFKYPRFNVYYVTQTKEIENNETMFKVLQRNMQGKVPQDLWNNNWLSGQWDIMFSEEGKLILRKQGKRFNNDIEYTLILVPDDDTWEADDGKIAKKSDK